MSIAFRAAAATFNVAAATVTVGCGPESRGEHWVADSTAYVASLDRWLRDSAVVDSVSRTVDLTELVTAYRKMVTAAQPLDELPTVSCAQSRVFWDYGSLAADVAMERARDSVVHLVGEKAVAAATARTPSYASVEMPHYTKCRGKQPEHRKSVGTTPLDTRDPRPLAPRGWPK